MAHSTLNTRHAVPGIPVPAGERSPTAVPLDAGGTRPRAPHLLDGPRAVAFNLALFPDRDRAILWRFIIDRAIDAGGDHYVESLADLLAANGLDPRARPGQPSWCVLAQDGKRGAVRVADGWAEMPARALALAVEEDGLGPHPRFTRWRAAPSAPGQPPLRDVNLWPRRVVMQRRDSGATGRRARKGAAR